VVWVDAHADCCVPGNSDYPYYHGMPVAHLLNWIPKNYLNGFEWLYEQKNCFLNPRNLVYIGLRSIDPDEIKILKEK
jgi:arginase family enzyme